MGGGRKRLRIKEQRRKSEERWEEDSPSDPIQTTN